MYWAKADISQSERQERTPFKSVHPDRRSYSKDETVSSSPGKRHPKLNSTVQVEGKDLNPTEAVARAAAASIGSNEVIASSEIGRKNMSWAF